MSTKLRGVRLFSRRAFVGSSVGAALSAGCSGRGGVSSASIESTPRLRVENGRFVRHGRPFFMAGMNYWAALPLARSGDAGRWQRLLRELDGLRDLGINALRIMGGTEGPDSEPLRISPSLQPDRGRYDEASVVGLLRLVEAIERRGMVAIICLTNFWPWSGGMAQYVSWAEGSRIPYPPPFQGGDWSAYQAYAAKFYSSDRARAAFRDFVGYLVPMLVKSPAVIWELANEPRGVGNVDAYNEWLRDTAAFIKSIAPDQLVTSGSEGETASPAYAGLDVVRNHASPHIDFVTCHLWAQNWGWVAPATLAEDFPKALSLAETYLRRHAKLAQTLGKPLVVEEFGFPRDRGSYDPAASVELRDRYFAAMYELVLSLFETTTMAGIMPWAWAGDELPSKPGEPWKPGDTFTGDPPHENAGWYSVYRKDSTTSVIRDWSAKISAYASSGGA